MLESNPTCSGPTTAGARTPAWASFVLALILVFAAGVRLRLLSLPLERDEGEFAYAGQLILEGVPPYELAYNMKLPGTYAAYAMIMAIFGQTPAGIHLGLLFVNAGSTLLVFFLARRLCQKPPAPRGDIPRLWRGLDAGLAAAASHAVLSLNPSVLGFVAHATHFVVLFALGGLLLLLRGIEKGRLRTIFLSGLLLGLAILMKQPGAAFLMLAALYLAWKGMRLRPIPWRPLAAQESLLLAGAAVPLGLTFLILWAAGVFYRFWFWTFNYAAQYGSLIPLTAGIRHLAEVFGDRVGSATGLWGLAAVGLTAIAWDRRVRAAGPMLVGLLVFSFLGAGAGLRWQEHYFILLLPAIAIPAGMAVAAAMDWAVRRRLPRAVQATPALVLLAALAYAISAERAMLLQMTPEAVSREIYSANPFPESLPIAEYLRRHTTPQDRIAVLGSEPQIYFYAHRRSATGYIYMYGMMEPQPYARAMQEEMVREIEAAKPLYVVHVGVNSSWMVWSDTPRWIFRWIDRFLRENYDRVGVIDIRSPEETVYRWNSKALGYLPSSEFHLYVYRAKSAAPGRSRPPPDGPQDPAAP